jgi:EAL and modified HD-GYP domain-containing signal transduction protein
LLALADIVKVDFRASTLPEQADIARHCRARGKRLLAEKVETRAEFDTARQQGYDLFQGYFFARPETLRSRVPPGIQQNYWRLLVALQRDELDYDQLLDVVRRDPSLTFQLLRSVNSAAMGLRHRVESLSQALILLGEQQIRRWATLAALVGLAEQRPTVLVSKALTRARLAELLAGEAGLPQHGEELFLLGILSLGEAMLQIPLTQILAELPLSELCQRVLQDTKDEVTPVHQLFRLAVICEEGDWETLSNSALPFGFSIATLARCTSGALRWADQAVSLRSATG